MKTLLILSTLSFLTTAVFAESQNVLLQVRVDSERGAKDDHNPKTPEESRAHWLIVRVTNPSTLKMEGLSLKWTLYASDLKRGHDDIVIEKSGSTNFAIEASGHFTDITTPKVVFEWTPQHSVRTGSGRRQGFKKVDEAGHRYHGYAVQVFQNGTVIGETSSDLKLLNATR